MSAKIILFSELGFRGSVAIHQSNDNDLEVNNKSFEFASAVVVAGNWELHSEPQYAGDMLDLREDGGPDFDGTYEDFSAWGGSAEFLVKSLQHDQ